MNKSKDEKKAEQYYHKVLKYVENNKTGKGTTYSNDLDRVCRELFGIKFKGVFASDKIPRLSSLAPYCILNLDRSSEPGSHWVALAKCKEGAMFYDSFGRNATSIIKNIRFSGNGKIVDSDTTDKEQKTVQLNCGARCIAWLLVFNDLGEEYAKLI